MRGERRRPGRFEPRWEETGAGEIAICGRRPVLESLRLGQPPRRIWIARGERHGAALGEIAALAAERGVPVEEVPPERLEARAEGAHHQGVLALCRPPRLLSLDELVERARRPGADRPPILVMAAGIQDPQNLGALIRTAEAAGAGGCLIGRHRAAGLTPAAIRASAGAALHLPVAQVTNLARSLEALKGAGFWSVGADPEAALCYDEIDWTVPTVLVIGHEGEGIPRLVREACDRLVRLPMLGRVGSLNAAAAAAVLLYEALRQGRRKPAPHPG